MLIVCWRNSPFVLFQSCLGYSWTFTSIWILEPACQIPLKSWSGFDWGLCWIYRFIEGIKRSKNINSWHWGYGLEKVCVHSPTGSLDHWRQLWPWGPGPCVWLRVTQGHRGSSRGCCGAPSWDPESWCGRTDSNTVHILKCTLSTSWGHPASAEGDQGTSNKNPCLWSREWG